MSEWESELYVCVFDKMVETNVIDVRELDFLNLALLALTLDAKIFHGSGPIIGNYTGNISAIPQPAFKVRQSGVIYIESRDRSLTRIATQTELEVLRNRTISSPAVVEKAAQSYFGFRDWSPSFDKFSSEYAYRTCNFLHTKH
nr:hypothetical protein [Roseobacter sp. HKCCA0434]